MEKIATEVITMAVPVLLQRSCYYTGMISSTDSLTMMG